MTEEYSSEPPRRRGATTAQIKDDINSGRTGDKVAGVDPGLSPLGTDDEAGGSTFDPEWIERTREQELAGRPGNATPNAATPELQPNARIGPQRNLVLAAVVGAAAALLLAVLLLAVL
jgi:hypothetical protein